MPAFHSMRVFVQGLQTDLADARNGLATKWSSCQVEGQNNQLTALKRGMYGRVRVEILRACHISGCTQIPPEPVILQHGSEDYSRFR
jgi:hypothetical protein